MLSLAVALIAIITYSALFAVVRVPWLAIDVAAAAVATGVAYALRASLAGVWGTDGWRRAWLAALLCLVLVIVQQLLVHANPYVGSAETVYLQTLRAGTIIRTAPYPFSARWLEPFLAGPWNVLPTTDGDAIRAINAGGLVLAAFWLIALLRRYGVPYALAASAPLYVLGSYLGMYAGISRLLLDPVNYALFVALAHLLLRRRCDVLLAATLLVTAFNSEKVLYWFPVIALSTWTLTPGSWGQKLTSSARRTLLVCAPVVVYFLILRAYLTPSRVLNYWLPGKLHQWTNLVFPFGALTIFAIMGFVRSPRMRPLAVLLVPIYASVLITTDTRRMVAYSFVVLTPLAFAYLARALATRLSVVVFATCLVVRGMTMGLWAADPARHVVLRGVLLAVEVALGCILVVQERLRGLHVPWDRREGSPRFGANYDVGARSARCTACGSRSRHLGAGSWRRPRFD